jgi:hypothetical protein
MAEKNSLWKNIRNKAAKNRRTGAKPKKPTAEMLRQEAKIKAKKADGGPVNTLEGDLISKVIMNRNRDKDFVQRAYAVGEYPESNMFVQPDANEFGQKNSHLMSWGEDERGQSYMYPEVMNPNNEAIRVPNQYADYISSTGYKKATGMPYAEGGYMYPDGGKTKVYTDPNEFKKAKQAYNDSLSAFKSTDYYRQNLRNLSAQVIRSIDDEYNIYRTHTYDEYLHPTIKPNEVLAHMYTSIIPLYKKPEVKPVLGKPEIDYLPSKSFTNNNVKPGAVGNIQDLQPLEINMNNFYEGTHETYRRSPYEDPMNKVWISGKGYETVNDEKLKKLSDQYLLEDLNQKSNGGYMYPDGGPVTSSNSPSNFDRSSKTTYDYFKKWYEGRAKNLKFTDVANSRLNLLNSGQYPKANILPYDQMTTEGLYTPSKNTIDYSDTDLNNKYYGNINTLMTHENDHWLSNKAPQEFLNISSEFPKDFKNNKDWLSGKDALTQDEEIKARLSVWRQLNNIDPTKDYSPKELRSIINKNLNDENLDSNVKDIYELIKGDAEKLKYLNDSFVYNNSKNNNIQYAADGGPIDDKKTNEKKYYRRNSEEYKDYLIRKRLNDFSKLPYFQKEYLLDYGSNTGFHSVFSDENQLSSMSDTDWNNLINVQVPKYNSEGEPEYIKEDPKTGSYGSAIDYSYTTELPQHQYGEIPNWSNYYYDDLDYEKNLNNIFKKYKPSKYHNMTKWGSDPTTNSYSNIKNRPNAPWKKPYTKEIEDETNLAELQKYYPELTKENLESHVNWRRSNPLYIKNKLGLDNNWEKEWGDKYGENREHDINWHAQRGRYYPENVVNDLQQNTNPIPYWDEPSIQIETLPELEYLKSIPFKNFETNNEPLKLKPIETPFSPSKVLIREMGNLDRNRKQGEKRLPEVYIDDKKGWRPISFSDYQMYKEQYPGSDTPQGWIKQKAKGGYYAEGGDIKNEPVTLYNKAYYNPDQDRIIPYAGSQDNKYYQLPGDKIIQSRLPEFEIIEDTGLYNPNVVGPAASRYMPSETGLVQNPNFRGGDALEYVPIESALLPASLPFKATSTLGKIGLGAAEMVNPISGFRSTSKLLNNKSNFGPFGSYKPSSNPTKYESLFNQQKDNVLKDLETTEGRKRIQNLIDNNKHLSRLTPDDVIEDIRQTKFTTKEPAYTDDKDSHIEKQIRQLVKQGKIDKKYLFSNRKKAFANNHQWIEDKDGNTVYFDVNPSNGFAWRWQGVSNPGFVSIGDNRSKEDALRVFEHELSHIFQRNNPLLGIDDLIRGISTKSNRKLILGDLFRKKSIFDQKHYFRTGSNKKEAAPFGAEIRSDLLRQGILKNRYDPITPQMVKDHYNAYINSNNNEINLRLYNFMKNEDKNFDLLSNAMNNMPALLPTIGVGAAGLIGGAGAIQSSQPEQQSYGGPINPYMYYSGGPMQYEVGGKVWKNIAAGLYGAGEGILDTVTMGATDQLTDRGFDYLTKVGNKNIDLNDPDDVKFLKTQQQVKGYSNTAGAIGTALVTGNVQGAITQGTKGLNTAFQASDWASDDFKKWSQGVSGVAGLAAGFAGGLNSDSFNAAAKAGTGVAGFGQKAGKIGSFGNQAMGMIGGNQQPLWQQGEARQDYLNSPEYLAMKNRQNQQYVNQGLSFSNGGNVNNNSLNLQNSMRNRYNSYRKKSKGGTFHQYGINQIPDSAGLHHQNAYGGVPIGPDAMAEGGEYVLDDNYVVSDQVNGMNTQTDEFGNTMAENLKTRLNKYTLRDLDSKNKGELRRPNDSIAQNTIDQIKQQAMMETEMARAEAQAQEEQNMAMRDAAVQYAAAGGKLNKDITKIVEEEYAAAYGGQINPKKYKGLNMPYSSGGKLPKEVLRARVESHMSPQEADAYVKQYGEGGGIHIKESKKGTFTAAATKHGKSVQEFARQVLANKDNYSSAMVKKANFAKNAAGWKHAQGGPMVSNVPQPFNGPSAQNRGGMMVEYGRGGMMYDGGDLFDLPGMADMSSSEYNSINTYLNNLNTPNVVDNQGNTSSILGRPRNNNTSQPIQPIGGMQSQNFQQLPTDNTMPGLVGNIEPFNYTNLPTDPNDTNISIPSIQSTIPGYDIQRKNFKEPLNSNIPMSGIVGNVEPMPGLSKDANYLSPLQKYLANNYPESLNKLKFLEAENEEGKFEYGTSFKPVTNNQSENNPSNQPNQGLTGLDYASMGMQALGPLSQLYYGLKGPDDVNYERITADKIDPYRAITLANEESRRAQDTAGYNLKQNAPTSGSYMANMRALGLGAGKQRGAQTAATQYQADVANTQMQNQVNAQNAQISMQEQIDRLQEKDAARTNVTEGLSGVGSSTANMIRDYRTNQVNQTIANNIGTNNFKLDTANKTITYRGDDGQTYTIPLESVIPNNYKEQSNTPQFQRDFDKSLNRGFKNRFTGPNAGR